MTEPSTLFQNCKKGFYKSFVKEFTKDSFKTLASYSFDINFFDQKENPERNDNRIFIDNSGKPIKLMLFGEIAHSSLGTQLDCKGNHFMKADNVRMFFCSAYIDI